MKNRLINALFEQFDRDKNLIARNLLEVMDEIVLQTENDYEILTMVIKCERKDNNANKTNNK